MKKFLAISLVLTIVLSMVIVPVSMAAETWDENVVEVYTEDFEIYDVNENAYTDNDRVGAPESALWGVYGGRQENGEYVQDDEYDVGALIVADKIDGKSLFLSRYAVHNENVAYAFVCEEFVEEQVVLQFTFNFAKVGDYGVAIRIGTDITNIYDPWTFTNGIANLARIDGKVTLSTWDDDLTADGNGRKLAVVADDLDADTDYTVAFVMTPGSAEYKLVLNGEVMGTYTHYEAPSAFYGIRLDQHGYVDHENEDLIDEIYYDNFMVGYVSDEPAVQTGDVDGNGNINMLDVIALRRNLLNSTTYPVANEAAADADGNGNINMLDVIALRRYLLNATQYPLG